MADFLVDCCCGAEETRQVAIGLQTYLVSPGTKPEGGRSGKMKDNITPRSFLDAVPPEGAAIFLDFDGTLIDLAGTPDRIRIPPDLTSLLSRLVSATEGAVALVTARSIKNVLQFLPDAPVWLAGCHGGERRSDRGFWAHPMAGGSEVNCVQREVAALNAFGPDIIMEFKPLGAIVHYRAEPHLETALRRATDIIAAENPDFEAHPAKMAFDLRPRDVGKDHVLREWMTQPPFKDRVPVFFGDDPTDERALCWVQRAGGIAVKVGKGQSVAGHRVTNPTEARTLLADWLTGHGC